MKFNERAIREGRKSQTRRPVKASNSEWGSGPEDWSVMDFDKAFTNRGFLDHGDEYLSVPYGGDNEWLEGTAHRLYPTTLTGSTFQIAPDLTTRITAVRVERLQEMKHTDAFAEGFPKGIGPLIGGGSFADAWDTFYPDPPHNWASNPWVWVYGFERCK